MNIVSSITDADVVTTLQRGGVVLARTDTIYGLLARAEDQTAVERIYTLKGRDPEKSPITLISNLEQLYDPASQAIQEVIAGYWPGRVSIIVPSRHAPEWVRRHNDSVAYRLPDYPALQQLIDQVGALIAPSANPEGLPPARTIAEAINYFGDDVDLYVDGGEVPTDVQASKLLRVDDNGTVEQLR